MAIAVLRMRRNDDHERSWNDDNRKRSWNESNNDINNVNNNKRSHYDDEHNNGYNERRNVTDSNYADNRIRSDDKNSHHNDHVVESSFGVTRELFVGNVFLGGQSELDLQDFLNSAMKRAGLASTSQDPVIGIRMSIKYSFIEFRNAEDCTKALNLNGIPFRGKMLKIGRPAKYSGPLTPALTWQQLTGEVVPGDAPQTSDQNTKAYREIFVGNTSARMSETALRDLLGGAMQKMGMSNSGAVNPVLQVRHCDKFSFAEMRTAEDAANLLNLNGVPFSGTFLKLCRPSKYDGGNLTTAYRWEELYDLWTNGDLKLMTAGPPSRVIVITNMATEEELADPALYLDIMQDTRTECSQHGTVCSVIVPRSSGQETQSSAVGTVFVEMATEQQAVEVLLSLKGRSFDGRTVDVKFYPQAEFAQMIYTHVPSGIVITKSDGAVSLDRVLNSAAMHKVENSIARTRGGNNT